LRLACQPHTAWFVPGVDGVQNRLGGLQVHVGNPHGDQIPAAVLLLHLIVLDREVVPAVNGLVEVILQSFSSPYSFQTANPAIFVRRH